MYCRCGVYMCDFGVLDTGLCPECYSPSKARAEKEDRECTTQRRERSDDDDTDTDG